MPIYKGTTKIKDLFVGSTKISKVYYGSTLVYTSSLLPSGYVECEYIESTSTQWLDTGIGNINQDTSVEFTYEPSSYASFSGLKFLCGARDNVGSYGYPAYNFIFDSSYNKIFCTYGTIENDKQYINLTNGKHTISTNKNLIYVDGVLKVTYTYTNFSITNSMLIFTGRHWNGGVPDSRTTAAKLYSYKIWDNGTLVRDLIPCLDNTGTPCMYDTVSKTTLYNQGTGQFLFKIKAEIPETYTLCEYLQSTGTQYIDTNYYATNTSGINIDYAYTQSGNAGLCGIFQSQTPRTDTLFITTLSGQTSTVMYLISQGGELTNNVVPQIGTKYNGKINYLNNGKLILNNTTTGNDGSNGVVSTRTIKLFCRDNGRNLAYTNARIYECILTTGNTIARYLVPCLDNNGVPCMYDLVGKQSYYNQGTGQLGFKVDTSVLPSGYTSLSYLESTGTQYINTGIIYDTNNTYTISGKVNYSQKSTFSGSGWNAGGCFGLVSDGRISDGTSNGVYGVNKDITFTQTINSGSNSQTVTSFVVDGTEYSIQRAHSSLSAYAGNGGFGLFAVYSTDTYIYFASGKIYYYIISENGVIQKVLIPCLDNNNVPCMYDLVNKQTYYNAGTGSFNYGL